MSARHQMHTSSSPFMSLTLKEEYSPKKVIYFKFLHRENCCELGIASPAAAMNTYCEMNSVISGNKPLPFHSNCSDLR